MDEELKQALLEQIGVIKSGLDALSDPATPGEIQELKNQVYQLTVLITGPAAEPPAIPPPHQ